MPREIIPIATVLGNSLHLLIQVVLLLVFALFQGAGVNRYWAWLPLIWAMEVVLLCGLSLISSAVNVYVRDTRYLVESFNAVLFWLVPIVYPFPPPQYRPPFRAESGGRPGDGAARNSDGGPPPAATLLISSRPGIGRRAGAGPAAVPRMKRSFYDYL